MRALAFVVAAITTLTKLWTALLASGAVRLQVISPALSQGIPIETYTDGGLAVMLFAAVLLGTIGLFRTYPNPKNAAIFFGGAALAMLIPGMIPFGYVFTILLLIPAMQGANPLTTPDS